MNRAVNKVLVRNITYLRESNNLTQEKMSVLLEITRSRWSAWEEYRCNPPITCLLVLSKLFVVSVDDLITSDISRIPVRDPFYFNL
jgi:DNA-binding XRE family transcriptional regulator